MTKPRVGTKADPQAPPPPYPSISSIIYPPPFPHPVPNGALFPRQRDIRSDPRSQAPGHRTAPGARRPAFMRARSRFRTPPRFNTERGLSKNPGEIFYRDAPCGAWTHPRFRRPPSRRESLLIDIGQACLDFTVLSLKSWAIVFMPRVNKAWWLGQSIITFSPSWCISDVKFHPQISQGRHARGLPFSLPWRFALIIALDLSLPAIWRQAQEHMFCRTYGVVNFFSQIEHTLS